MVPLAETQITTSPAPRPARGELGGGAARRRPRRRRGQVSSAAAPPAKSTGVCARGRCRRCRRAPARRRAPSARSCRRRRSRPGRPAAKAAATAAAAAASAGSAGRDPRPRRRAGCRAAGRAPPPAAAPGCRRAWSCCASVRPMAMVIPPCRLIMPKQYQLSSGNFDRREIRPIRRFRFPFGIRLVLSAARESP